MEEQATKSDYMTLNKQTLIDYMKSKNLQVVYTDYDGSGDEGCVNGVYVQEVEVNEKSKEVTKHQKDLDPSDRVEVWRISGRFQTNEDGTHSWTTKAQKEQVAVTDAFRDFSSDFLELEGIDWYNNEGGYGEVYFYANENRVVLEHNTRIMDTEYHESEI